MWRISRPQRECFGHLARTLPTETEASITNKLSRGTVAATFFLAALVVLEAPGIRLEDI
ncbi:MAG: DUF6471 domain-containing protein [Aestuariivirga sp.]